MRLNIRITSRFLKLFTLSLLLLGSSYSSLFAAQIAFPTAEGFGKNTTIKSNKVGALAGCDSLVLKDGATLQLLATVDTVNTLQLGDVYVPKGVYTASKYPSFISGSGSLVVLDGPDITMNITEFTTVGYSLIVAPTPTKDITKILFTSEEIGEAVFTLYSQNGEKIERIVKRANGKKESFILNKIAHIKRGVYFVEMNINGEKKSVSKLVLIH